MKINDVTLADLALALSAERKSQKLSREEVAAVCGVSTSFIRDAESSPENCSLSKLAKLINGLGLSLEVSGLLVPQLDSSKSKQGFHQADFSVPDPQLLARGIESNAKGEAS
jgi:HTH-type transcriptional regulator/antitoxin HipB